MAWLPRFNCSNDFFQTPTFFQILTFAASTFYFLWPRRKPLDNCIHFNAHTLYFRFVCLYGELLAVTGRDSEDSMRAIITKVLRQPLLYRAFFTTAEKCGALELVELGQPCKKCENCLTQENKISIYEEIESKVSINRLFDAVSMLACKRLIRQSAE